MYLSYCILDVHGDCTYDMHENENSLAYKYPLPPPKNCGTNSKKNELGKKILIFSKSLPNVTKHGLKVPKFITD